MRTVGLTGFSQWRLGEVFQKWVRVSLMCKEIHGKDVPQTGKAPSACRSRPLGD